MKHVSTIAKQSYSKMNMMCGNFVFGQQTKTSTFVNPYAQKIKAKPFPSVTPLPIPQNKNTPQQKADKLNTLKNTDFNKQRDDFVDRQQSIQPTKPQPPM